jgi:hypothetical protein
MTRWDNLVEPTEEESIEEMIEHKLDQVHGPFLGRVQRYDPVLQVADVVPLVRHAVHDPDGGITHEDFPVIPCCPVAWPGITGFFMAFDLRPGDIVVCLTMTNAYGHWWAGDGSVTDPGDLRRNHIANSIVLPLNVRRRGAPLRKVPVHLEDERFTVGADADDGTRITLLSDGTIRVTRGAAVRLQLDPNGDVHLAGAPGATKLLALADLVDDRLGTLRAAFNSHTHPTAPTGPVSAPTAVPGVIPVPSLVTVGAAKTKGF